MQLEAVKQEFLFHCKYRKLSPKTVKNYEKQIGYTSKTLDLVAYVHQRDLEAGV